MMGKKKGISDRLLGVFRSAVRGLAPLNLDDGEFCVKNGVLKRYRGAGETVIVPKGVTRIGTCAFDWCTDLRSITLPKGVKEIDDAAFRYCNALKHITLPEGVTRIGVSAFGYCSRLTSIALPESLKEIGVSAFGNCSSLASVALPEGLTGIGERAFVRCSGLMHVTLPEGLKVIGKEAFDGCSSLKGITPGGAEAAAALIRQTIDDEQTCGLLMAGLLELAYETPSVLRTPELLHEPVFGALLRYAQQNRPERIAELLQARHEAGGEEPELVL